MTKQQATAEMKYRLGIYILQVLLDSGDISTEEAIRAKNILLDGSPRHRYGLYRNVLLSDAEFQSLKEQFPGDYAARIDRLSEYMASCGKTYKNHLATIRSWARKDAQRNIDYHHGMYTYDGNDSL